MSNSKFSKRIIASVPDLSKLFNDHLEDDDDVPSLASSEGSPQLSDEDALATISSLPSPENKLQWEFYGLTLWLELEEYDNDLTNAINDLAEVHNVEPIPKSHTTAIYGMTHLSIDEAKRKLHSFKEVVPQWPEFARPVAVVQDIAENGKPGQVCTIAWSELTLATNEDHEKAVDLLYETFFGEDFTRTRPWKPHNSIAYDNPENSDLSLLETVGYVSRHTSLIRNTRRVEAISLWDTNGRMQDWKCLDRVYFKI